MTRNSKLIYLFCTMLFFVFLNGYLTEFSIQNCNQLADNPVFQIVYIQNTGAAFNIFEGFRAFLITFSAIAIFIVLYFTIKQIKKIPAFGIFFISLLLSGIFNNMFERLTFGFVRDFIKLNFVDFPVFNISDIFINIGVIGIVYVISKYNYFKK